MFKGLRTVHVRVWIRRSPLCSVLDVLVVGSHHMLHAPQLQFPPPPNPFDSPQPARVSAFSNDNNTENL